MAAAEIRPRRGLPARHGRVPAARARRLGIALQEHAAVDPRVVDDADQPAFAFDDPTVEFLQPQRQFLDPVGMEDDDGQRLAERRGAAAATCAIEGAQNRAKQLGLERRQRCGLLVDPGRGRAGDGTGPGGNARLGARQIDDIAQGRIAGAQRLRPRRDRLAQQRAALQRSQHRGLAAFNALSESHFLVARQQVGGGNFLQIPAQRIGRAAEIDLRQVATRRHRLAGRFR